MSYAGPSRSESARRTPEPPRTTNGQSRMAIGRSPDTDWQQVAIFGAGLALGLALGAGVAMLTAPQSGAETRADIKRFAVKKRRAIGRKSSDAWDDLRAELRGARRALRRRKLVRDAEQEAEAYGG